MFVESAAPCRLRDTDNYTTVSACRRVCVMHFACVTGRRYPSPMLDGRLSSLFPSSKPFSVCYLPSSLPFRQFSPFIPLFNHHFLFFLFPLIAHLFFFPFSCLAFEVFTWCAGIEFRKYRRGFKCVSFNY